MFIKPQLPFGGLKYLGYRDSKQASKVGRPGLRFDHLSYRGCFVVMAIKSRMHQPARRDPGSFGSIRCEQR
jgi:hypothetical protein